MDIPATSVENVHIGITAQFANGSPLGTVTARMAWPLVGKKPTEEEWDTAEVLPGGAPEARWLRRLYGGDEEPSTRTVWIEVTAGDEVVVRKAGELWLT